VLQGVLSCIPLLLLDWVPLLLFLLLLWWLLLPLLLAVLLLLLLLPEQEPRTGIMCQLNGP